jgi:hypothetical protein
VLEALELTDMNTKSSVSSEFRLNRVELVPCVQCSACILVIPAQVVVAAALVMGLYNDASPPVPSTHATHRR